MTAKFVAALSMAAVLGFSLPALGQGSKEAGQAKSTTCVACHGVDGNSVNPEWPNLAGQHPSYIAKQLRAFREGQRENVLMSPMAMALSDQDIEDLAAYLPGARPSLLVEIGDWQIATNPAPAIGGAMLAAMLLAFGNEKFATWTECEIRRLIDVQYATLQYRSSQFKGADDEAAEISRLLQAARSGLLLSRWSSASTVHTSAVDESGLACAITASAGYGSGEMAPSTGIWLNNCVGELELNAAGLLTGPPGIRLPSNMAPTTARNNGAVMAAGSPGADRITTALHQFFVNYIQCGMGLETAVCHPRLHLDFVSDAPRVSVEPGVSLPPLDWQLRKYEDIGMFFGGVAAAVFDRQSGFEVAADPRRAGGTFVG